MIRRLTLSMLTLITIISTVDRDAEAGFLVKNESNDTIKVAVVKTFVDRDGFIYSNGWQPLKRGETKDFGGRFNTTHQFWVVVMRNGRPVTFGPKTFRCFKIRQMTAYLPRQLHNLQISNKFVAQSMNFDNWRPYLKSVNQRLYANAATKITPLLLQTNGFEMVITNTGCTMRSWR